MVVVVFIMSCTYLQMSVQQHKRMREEKGKMRKLVRFYLRKSSTKKTRQVEQKMNESAKKRQTQSEEKKKGE